MGRVREHDPVIIEEFNGLWSRGDDESCPLDHMLLATNIQFIHSGVETRQAAAPYASLVSYQKDIRQTMRVYNFTTQKLGQTFLVLSEGWIYHVVTPTDMRLIYNTGFVEDFAFIQIANRAYISPFRTITSPTGEKYQLGITTDYLRVYDPDNGDTVARLAAGFAPTNATFTPPVPPPAGKSDGGQKPLVSYNSTKDGKVTAGVHIITTTNGNGPATPDMSSVVNSPGDKMIQIDNIPLGPGGVDRRIAMTKAIPPNQYTGTPADYNSKLFLVYTIPAADNITTSVTIDLDDAGFPATFIVPDATPAPTLTTSLQVFNTDINGFCDAGFHLVGVVYESKSGYLSAPGPEHFGGNTYVNEGKSIRVKNIPLGPTNIGGATPWKRHIVSTKTIETYDGNQKNYQFFFVPNAILDETKQSVTELLINYYDSDLVADASHLSDNFNRIPCGVNLCEYHSRLVIVGDGHFPLKPDGITEDTTKPDNRSIAWVSAAGEPEAISQIDGLIITPLDGNPLTNCESFRDNLYLFKQNRTYSVVDNQDDPTTWGPVEVVDQGVGTCVHGIAEVLDSGGVNVDYLIVIDHSGLMLFNGTYARPELSWKIENIWTHFDKNSFHHFQIVNDSIRKKFWLTHPNWIHDPILNKDVPSQLIWMADYGNGLNPKDIRWALWNFEKVAVTSLVLYKNDKLILGTYSPDGGVWPGPGELLMVRSTSWPPDVDKYPKGITWPPYNFPIVNPGPIIPELGGGLLILDPTNDVKHDVFRDRSNPPASVNVPIEVHIRTALLGD